MNKMNKMNKKIRTTSVSRKRVKEVMYIKNLKRLRSRVQGIEISLEMAGEEKVPISAVSLSKYIRVKRMAKKLSQKLGRRLKTLEVRDIRRVLRANLSAQQLDERLFRSLVTAAEERATPGPDGEL